MLPPPWGRVGERVISRKAYVIPILKNNLIALARLAVLGVLSAARRLVILFFRIGIRLLG